VEVAPVGKVSPSGSEKRGGGIFHDGEELPTDSGEHGRLANRRTKIDLVVKRKGRGRETCERGLRHRLW